MKYYHCFVWTVSLLFALPVGISDNVHDLWILGKLETDDNKWKQGFCWVTSTMSTAYPWIFLYLPLVICFIVSIIICFIAYQRFKSGVALTLLHRLNILTLNFVNITCGIIYWLFLGILAASTASAETLNFLNPLILYIISTKGSVAVVVWIFVTELRSLFKNSDDDNIDLNDAMKEEILLYAVTGLQNTCHGQPTEIYPDGSFRKMITSNTTDSNIFAEKKWFIINIMLGDDELIKKILNQAKIAQTTKAFGERPSVANISYDELQKRGSRFKKSRTSSNIKDGDVEMINSDHSSTSDSPVYIADLARNVDDSMYEKLRIKTRRLFGEFQHATFYEYEYEYFRRIRKACKISPEEYSQAFDKKLKARLTQGGASGALFFFSHCEKFIAKSCSKAEKDVILSNAKSYCEYLEKHGGTYITKILGIYRLKIYGVKMNFFVMNNIFQAPPNNGINFSEKYDIKGSWIARNVSPPKDGQKMICMHCQKNFYFKKNITIIKKNTNRIPEPDSFGSRTVSNASTNSNGAQNPLSVGMQDIHPRRESNFIDDEEDRDICSYTVKGFHEPIQVMKDNDLKYKLNLTPNDARSLYKQLKKDADFLCDTLNVMDYSLLIGVQRAEYIVQDNIAVSRLSSTSEGRNTYISESAKTSFSGTGHLEVYKFTAPKSYCMGIIDFCQKWNIEKRVEQFYKLYFQQKDPLGVSAQEPNTYRNRFINHIAEILNVNGDFEESDHIQV